MKWFYRNRHYYYKKIVILLSLFSFLIFIPFTILIFNISKNKILNTIHTSNNKSLHQMKYNYDYFSEAMSNISLSLYLNNDNQALLYNHDISVYQSITQMKRIKDTTANVYSSIYAISIFNAGRDEVFTTLQADPSDYTEDLLTFVANTPNIPKLKPILREINITNANSSLYVFSYFMYDFTNNNQPSGFLIIDLNASWLIDNFVEAQKSTEIENHIYLVNTENNRVVTANHAAAPDVDNMLLSRFSASLKDDPAYNSDGSFYIEKIANEKYLVTYLTLDAQNNAIVLIQKYNEVFSDFISLRQNLILLISLWSILYIISILFISRELYRPISKLAAYINNFAGTDHISTSKNEFEQFQNVYRVSSEKLKKQNSHVHSLFLKRYQLERLITSDSKTEWQKFKDNQPNHWLLETSHCHFCLLNVKIDGFQNDASFEDHNFKLLLYAAENILDELFNRQYHAEIIQSSDFQLLGIVQVSDGDYTKEFKKIIQEAQNFIEKYYAVTITVYFSDAADNPEDFNSLYLQAVKALKYGFLFSPNSIISNETIMKNIQNTESMYSQDLDKKLINALKSENQELINDTLDKIFAQIKNLNYDNILINLMTLVNQTNNALKEMGRFRNTLSKIHYEQVYQKAINVEFLYDFEVYFKNYIKDALGTITQKNESDKRETFIRTITDYIDANFSDRNLTPQSIADLLGLSNKYVLRKFKEYCNISLNEYILQIRLAHAAALLADDTLPISHITAKVGLESETYFYRLFKKAYGCTPREYTQHIKKQ